MASRSLDRHRPVHGHLGRRPRRRRAARLQAVPRRRAGTTSSTRGPAAYENPFADLLAPTAYRNWDSDRRLDETESHGVVAEVLFPNTVPPFFAQGNLTALRADGRRTTTAAGPGCRRTTAGSPTSAPRRPAGAPASRRSSSTTSTTRSPRSGGRKEHMRRVRRRPAADGAAELAIAAAVGPVLRAALGAVRGARRRRSTSTAGSGLPDFGEHEAARAIMLIELAVVRAPAAVAPDLRRRARPAPEACASCSPSRAPAGSRAASTRSTGSTAA